MTNILDASHRSVVFSLLTIRGGEGPFVHYLRRTCSWKDHIFKTYALQ